MAHRRSNLAWWLAAALVAGAGVIACAILVPLDAPPESAIAPRSKPQAAAAVIPPLEAFEPLWELDLQRPLVDAPSAPARQEPAQPLAAQPVLRLVGTVIEPNHSVAFFETTPGSTEMKKVGDRIDGAVLSRIDADQVEALWRGQPLVLKVVPSTPVPASTPPTAALASPKPLPEPSADGVIHLFTDSEPPRKAPAPPASPR